MGSEGTLYTGTDAEWPWSYYREKSFCQALAWRGDPQAVQHHLRGQPRLVRLWPDRRTGGPDQRPCRVGAS